MKSQHFLALLFVAAFYWMYLLYQPFLLSIIIASLLAISTANIQHKLEGYTNSALLASIGSTLLLALLFFAPLGYFLTTVTLYLNTLDADTIETLYGRMLDWIDHTPSFLAFLKPQLETAIDGVGLGNLAGNALLIAGKIGGYSASFLKNALFIIIFYFFANYNGRAIINFFKKVIRLPQQDTTLLGFELSSVMSVVFYSIIATAMFEGALFGIAVKFMGYDGLLFGIMYGFASLIPVVGGALMWLPFMFYELSHGHTGSAVFIALYSIIVISIIADTFIKPMIIKYINFRVIKMEAKMNELLIFFAIIAGLSSFGFWGMILGPAITAFFLALIKLVEQYPKQEA
ncbi:MAG: AI-2E family transporter [Campylobacterota bacterium]|nr:AI-2E family transporter [Campylobacterota bacterium]